jgi:hypothetical protein
MAEMAGKWMEDHKVKFIKKHVPTKVSYSLPHTLTYIGFGCAFFNSSINLTTHVHV